MKHRTGFPDFLHLLSFAIIVCDGNLDVLYATSTKMTWLEEWVFSFELWYGRTASRWKDYEKRYDCTRLPLRKALLQKLSQILQCRALWPMYATHEEDLAFRGEDWEKSFDPIDGPRIIMHNSTNLPYQNPSKCIFAMWNVE